MPKQTHITIETDSLLILKGGVSLRAWCGHCGAEADFIPIAGVGIVSNLAAPEIRAWMESEDLHEAVAADGSPLICFNSLLKLLPHNQTQRRSV